MTAGFPRKRHAFAGTVALIFMLAGSVAGSFMKDRFLQNTDLGIHGAVAMLIIVLGLFGIISGYFLYTTPRKRKILPVVHGVNNFAILLLALVQILSGTAAYLRYVLRW
jgi:hypothetical protein